MEVTNSNLYILSVLVTVGIPHTLGDTRYEDYQNLKRQPLGDTRYEDYQNLKRHLFHNYSTDIRPLRNQSESLKVDVTFDVFSIREVDSTTSQFSIRGTFLLSWLDELLSWEEGEFGGVQRIHPGLDAIWTPSLFLGNCATDTDCELLSKISRHTVYSDGRVRVSALGYFSVYCPFDMSYFPFDEQSCDLKYNSIDDNVGSVNYHVCDPGHFDLKTVHDEWRILNSSMKTTTFTVMGGQNYSGVRINFHIQRKPLFHVLNLIIPIVVISFLSVLVFLVPAESGEKLSFSLTSLVSLAVFVSFMSGQIPVSSENVPHLTVYLSLMVLLNALAVIATVIGLLPHKQGGQLPTSGQQQQGGQLLTSGQQHQGGQLITSGEKSPKVPSLLKTLNLSPRTIFKGTKGRDSLLFMIFSFIMVTITFFMMANLVLQII